jgi:hypothetical protein
VKARHGPQKALEQDRFMVANMVVSAVGVICFVKFTPEIFMLLVTGWFIR